MAIAVVSGHRVRSVTRETFGYDKLRSGQEEAIRAILAGRDTLAVMPTGSGKSAVYQIAGLMMPGVTMVVSPLIALQRDQVRGLVEDEVAASAELNSTLSDSEREAVLTGLREAAYEFLFLGPEQLANDETMEALRAAAPSLIAVDEAHCISEWGHDFRPAYLRLGTMIQELGHPTIVALTATASPPVRSEIVERLCMRNPVVVVHGFDRPNIRLAVERFRHADEKRAALLERVMAAEKPGIVYAATRRDTREVAAALAERGLRAAAYHAGLKASERTDIQAAFMEDELEVIVATIAFGMGIDKSNVRFVYHHDISDALDAYYQEIGRAGRDDAPAEALLFYHPDDLNLRRFQAGAGQLEIEQVERVVTAVLEREEPVEPGELLEETELSESRLTRVLGRLEETGVVEILPNGQVAQAVPKIDALEVAAEATEAQENLHKFAQSRIEMMRQYADLTRCRREFLLNYFGEEYAAPCGNCDICEAGVLPMEEPADLPFPVGSAVRHASWGEGQVMRYEMDAGAAKMLVLFDTVGYRALAVDVALENGLVTAEE